jgi:hypothetical protein
VLTGVLFGLAPAMSVVADVAERSAEGRRSDRKRGSLALAIAAGPGHRGGGAIPCASGGAGLLLRSMVSLLSVDPGFVPERLVTMWISFSSSKYAETARPSDS